MYEEREPVWDSGRLRSAEHVDADAGPDDNQGKVFFFPGHSLVMADDFESKDLLRWSMAIP